MKKTVVLFLLTGLFLRCSVDSLQTIYYSVNEPVFTSSTAFRNSIKVTANIHELDECGKICFYNDYLYISEPGKGIHIIDNTNPSLPQKKGYIEIAGNQDLVVRDNCLYADALVDLVWFDVSNPSQPVLKGRIENLFPEALPPIENEYGYDYTLCQAGIAQGKIVTGWQLKEHKQKNHYRSNSSESLYDFSAPTLTQGNPFGGTKRASTTCFSLYDDYLYTVANYQMNIMDLSGEKPEKAADNIFAGNAETVFSYRDKLFIGTPSGLTIYSIEDPLHPVFYSQIMHVYSNCNPFAVDEDLVYITILSGNLCGQTIDQLRIFDISDADSPTEVASYSMNSPKGLGINQGMLFLCDAGLKIFKTGDPKTLINNQFTYYTQVDGYDLLFFNNILLIIADDGLYQYDYSFYSASSNAGNIRLLSVIPRKLHL